MRLLAGKGRGGSRTAPTGIQPHPMRSTTSWLHACYQRILPVEFPARRVIVDVLADLSHGIFAAHHVFEVIPLPQGTGGKTMREIDPFRADGLERANEASQGFAFNRRRSRGGSRTAPTRFVSDHDEAVEMVRHDNIFVQYHVRVLGPKTLPGIGHQLACLVQAHAGIHNLTEQASPPLDDDGDEVRACLRVVVVLQANRPATPGLCRRVGKTQCFLTLDMNKTSGLDPPNTAILRV